MVLASLRRALAGSLCSSVVALAALGACSDQSLGNREPPNFVADGAAADAATGDGGVTTTREGVVRVAAFNVRRFFDTVCDTGKCGTNGFEELASQSVFDTKADVIAKGIQVIQPDVIALEEIENTACLDALKARLSALGMDYPIAKLGETGALGSVDVAILAKGSLAEVRTHRDTPLKRPDGTSTTFSRELLEIRMTFGAKTLVMFAAHFRSKVDDDPGRRLAEAQATHDIVTATAKSFPDALVVLGGDLNDFPGSPPIAALESSGLLLRVASDRPVDQQATYRFNGVDVAIDHLFLGAGQKARYVGGSFTVYREGTRGFAGSDHGAIAADFSLQ